MSRVREGIVELQVDVPWVYSREPSGSFVAASERLGLVVEAADHAALLGAIPRAHEAVLAWAETRDRLAPLAEALRWSLPRPVARGVKLRPTWQLLRTAPRGTGATVAVRAAELALRVLDFQPQLEVDRWVLLAHPQRPRPLLLPDAGRMDLVAATAVLRHAGMSESALEAFQSTVGSG